MWYNQYTICNGPARVDAMRGVLGVMTCIQWVYIAWYDIKKSGCDVIRISYDVIHIVAVLSYIPWGLYDR